MRSTPFGHPVLCRHLLHYRGSLHKAPHNLCSQNKYHMTCTSLDVPHVFVCSALDLSGLELDTEVSDNEEEADADAAAMHTLVDMIARDDNLEAPSELLRPTAPSSAFGAFGGQGAFAKPPRRLAHSQSFPANMT